MGSSQSSSSLKRYAENVLWIGGVAGLFIIAFWPISFLIWFLTYLYHHSVLTQATILTKLETIESLLTKETPVENEVLQMEAVQES